ncbi:MAG: tetratricopeptide repeat protein [bacterium]|jgi:tetratricopeptide (TPR) repeat protein|nr:tetratricopeptide repeat protein [bacterium]
MQTEKWMKLTLIALLGMGQIAWINPLRDRVKEANTAYANAEYERAIQLYTDIAATYAPESKEMHFNIGNSWFRQEKYDKAIEEFNHVLGSPDAKLDAQAYYSMGNCHFRTENYAEAINAYIESLKLNPDDEDAKYNLEVARRKLKDQMDKNKEQQEQQNQDQQQEEEQQNQEPQQNQDQQEQEQQNQEQQNQEQPQDQQQEQEQQQQPQPQPQEEQPQTEPQAGQEAAEEKRELSKEEAMQLLDHLEAAEKEHRKQVQQRRQGEPQSQQGW